MTDAVLTQFIERARTAGACKEEIDAITDCGTLERAMAHERAPYWAYWYARNVVHGPWEPGEDVIATDAHWAYLYARDVVCGPWEPGETAIATDAHWAYLYARDVVCGPWAPGEDAIAKDADWACWYKRLTGKELRHG